ncbi:MAG: 2-C-methyl-D-erythritol 4-phosphate cytidylyltransferase [Dehalococcoidia bacterium]|nr:2-C-methyl-D-erythritol 4-phosphate cytidylyltransferase [Dehalococcoidia bacterium]
MSRQNSIKKPRIGAIILAAGESQRTGTINKLSVTLQEKPLLAWSVDTCQQCQFIEQIIIVVNEKTQELGQRLKEERKWSRAALCPGGARRQDSVTQGLSRLKEYDWILIHDGARPFLTAKLLEDGLRAAHETGAAIAAVPVKETIKVVDEKNLVRKTPLRHELWIAQTPQVFRGDIIIQAYKEVNSEVPDDAAAVELLGNSVKLYMGDYNNIKVTTLEDLALAKIIAERISEEK